MKNNCSHLILHFLTCINCKLFSSYHVKKNIRMDFYSAQIQSTGFPVLKSDTLILISILSLSTSCLSLIGIRVTRAHTRDYLITHVLHMPINNPSDAIIHVAIFIDTFMRTAVKLRGMSLGHHHYSVHLTICSLQANVNLLFKWTVH